MPWDLAWDFFLISVLFKDEGVYSFLYSLDLGEELNCLAFDGQTILVGGGSGTLSVWDILHVRPVGKIQAHKGPITSLWVSGDGQFLATGGDDRRVVVWKSTLKKSWITMNDQKQLLLQICDFILVTIVTTFFNMTFFYSENSSFQP